MSSDPPADQEPITELQQPPSNPQPESQAPAIKSAPDDIRHQVEQEQALTDAQNRLKELEGDVERLKGEKQGLQGEKDGAGKHSYCRGHGIVQDGWQADLQPTVSTTNQLRTQLSSIQSLHHKSTSESAVLQTRLDVSVLWASQPKLRGCGSQIHLADNIVSCLGYREREERAS